MDRFIYQDTAMNDQIFYFISIVSHDFFRFDSNFHVFENAFEIYDSLISVQTYFSIYITRSCQCYIASYKSGQIFRFHFT